MEAAATVHAGDLSRLIGFGDESAKEELQDVEWQGVRARGRSVSESKEGLSRGESRWVIQGFGWSESQWNSVLREVHLGKYESRMTEIR
jgi:hypothetical protein